MSRQAAAGGVAFENQRGDHMGGGSIIVGQVRQAVSQRPGDVKGSMSGQQYQ